MEHGFWHERWEKNEIAFHEGDANPSLVRHFSALNLPEGSRVFLPLCGKTRDIAWLLSRGCRVAGAELSRIAIGQLFQELGVAPDIIRAGALEHYRAPEIDIFVGDILDLTRGTLGPVDALYDRAALVALPAAMRSRYAMHLMDLTQKAPQLLICYEYDQSRMEGPPFSISKDEVRRHYGGSYELSLLESRSLPGGLKGKCPAIENVWLLNRASGP